MYDELIKDLREWPRVCVEYTGSLDELHDKAADAIEELQGRAKVLEKVADKWCEAMPKWIPVTERLPENQGQFLTRYGYGDASIETGQFFYGVLYYFYADAEPHWQHESAGVEVTHWMPLPEPPKEV